MPVEVHVVEHPLVADSLRRIRDKSTPDALFRVDLSRIGTLLISAATESLPTEDVTVETPLATAPARRLAVQYGRNRKRDRRGVLDSHVERTTMFYRGPERRLQMTLDITGKLLQAVAELRRHPATPVGPVAAAFADVDRVVAFEPNRPRGVWASGSKRWVTASSAGGKRPRAVRSAKRDTGV